MIASLAAHLIGNGAGPSELSVATDPGLSVSISQLMR